MSRARLLLTCVAVGVVGALAVSCNALLGNDDKSLEGVDASVDGAVEATPGGDDAADAPATEAGSDGARDSSATDGPGESGPPDASDAGDAGDARADAGHDAGQDAGQDAGPCGATDTVENCSACGSACAAPDAGAFGVLANACNGTTCNYTCITGFLDCNAATAPDLDGCECEAPGATCCGDVCPVQHTNGLGQVNSSFYDCTATGAYTEQLALDSCTAFAGSAADCTLGQCDAVDGGFNGDLVVCATGSSTDCPCWVYSGPDTGRVHNPLAPSPSCYCGVPGDPSYQ